MSEIIEGWIEYHHHHGWLKGYFRLYNGGILQRFDHPKHPACRFQIDLKDVYDSMCIGSYTLKMTGNYAFFFRQILPNNSNKRSKKKNRPASDTVSCRYKRAHVHATELPKASTRDAVVSFQE
jgi:hypothetical protein